MEIIHELENTPRDIYTGAIGFITPENDFTFNVPIRTITFPKGSKHGTLGIGGGIIYESDPVDEWHESKLKARFITGINRQFKMIETLRYDASNKQVLRLDKHLERLKQSASCFEYPVDEAYVAKMIDGHVKQYTGVVDLKLRVLLDEAGELEINSEALPELSNFGTALSESAMLKATLQTEDHALGTPLPKVCLSPIKLDETNLFRQHKSTNRALYNIAYSTAEAEGFYDVLFLNTQVNLAEASRHNLFIKQGNKLYTPPLEDGALPGVMRDELLAAGIDLAASSSLRVVEKSLTLEDLKRADRVYLSNSVRGLVEVEFIDS
jgi:para-aminobenzoate synthetase/4-amino-4-deoxychorismate lyase